MCVQTRPFTVREMIHHSSPDIQTHTPPPPKMDRYQSPAPAQVLAFNNQPIIEEEDGG